MQEDFEEVTILEKPALFHLYSNRPEYGSTWLSVYMKCGTMTHNQGCAVADCKRYSCKSLGTLITRDEIKLPTDGYLDIHPDDLNYDCGDCHTMKEFMENTRRK